MSVSQDRQNGIRQRCLACVPLVILASPNGWRMTQDDEYGDLKVREQSERQAAKNAEVIVEWVLKEAPRCLRLLLEAIKVDADARTTEGAELYTTPLLALIVVTAARFISPRISAAKGRYDLLAWSQSDRSLWISSENEELAKQILASLFSADSTWTSMKLPAEVSDIVFKEYLRPLFSATSSANLNQQIGRAHKQVGTVHSSQPMEDDIIWKGGDRQRASAVRVLGHEVLARASGETADGQQRHSGLGCEGVLFICCQSLALRSLEESTTTQEDIWSQNWPNVIPPLLQMLEDPSPRYRLAAARILSETLLLAQPDTRTGRQVSSLLRRTGLSSLLLQNLEASLTFISHRIAGPLLQSTSEAWIRLVLITTAESTDGGRARYERLSELMDKGVLRVWAYAPSGTAQDALGGEAIIERADAGLRVKEMDDVVEASFVTLAKLAHEDVLGVGIVRYLDVTLEYLTQQFCSTEAKVERFKAKRNVEASISLGRELQAIAAMSAIIGAAKSCPSLQSWAGRCITAVARSWTVLEKANVRSKERTRLDAEMASLIRRLETHASAPTKKCMARLRDLDQTFFAPFVGMHA